MSNKASKTESPDEATQLERLMAAPDTMTWAKIRKVRLANFKATEEARKKRGKTSTSPLGQRPSLDAEHVAMPKPKPDQD
jgi:hypothetical protein